MTRKEQTALEMNRGTKMVNKATREARMDQWHKEKRITVIPYLRFSIKEEYTDPLMTGTIFDTRAATSRPARDPTHTTVQIGDIFFNEPAADYPSEVLFAKVALALQAGVS